MTAALSVLTGVGPGVVVRVGRSTRGGPRPTISGAAAQAMVRAGLATRTFVPAHDEAGRWVRDGWRMDLVEVSP